MGAFPTARLSQSCWELSQIDQYRVSRLSLLQVSLPAYQPPEVLGAARNELAESSASATDCWALGVSHVNVNSTLLDLSPIHICEAN